MDIFRSMTQTVLGAPQPGQQPTGADTVDRLIDRVQSSTLLEDRRDGCRALKAMSKKYRVLVGAHGMDVLIQVLESDRGDHEIVNYALETLNNITSNEVFQEEIEDEAIQPETLAKVGEQFTEIFTKRSENIALVVGLLDEFDFKVRYSAIKLLMNLLTNRPKDLQEAILVIPSGVSKLMDLLSDSREIIRNDMLLLLTQLTRNNTSLQKIVAFENAFDHLFAIMKDEGHTEGGVVVEDCLLLMLSLLTNNPSNQTFFKEGTYIQRLTTFFTTPLEVNEEGWAAQKVSNMHYMLKLVRTLVSPHNPTQVVQACQKVMSGCGLLQALCGLLMAGGVPADILTDTIITVSELIRGNQHNQEFFLTVMAPSNPPKPAIVVLLMSMVNDKQPFTLRCSVLYCFQCFLYRNQPGQTQIVQTLLPQTADANQITSGQLLCGGLFSPDPVSNWFSAIALSHALLDNPSQKEQLLRVQLATGAGSPSVSLLQQCATLLQSSSSRLTKFGLLQLLSTWLAQCPIACTHLLNLPNMVPYLLTNVSATDHDELEVTCQGLCAFLLGLCSQFNDGSVTSFTREALTQLVVDRVGAENFSDKLSNTTKIEAYSRAAKYPQLSAKDHTQLVFDHEFCRLFKSLEGSALKAVTPQLMNGSMNGDVSPCEVIQYKEIIRDQDIELNKVKQSLQETVQQLESVQRQNQELLSSLTKVQEEVNGLRMQNSDNNEINSQNNSNMKVTSSVLDSGQATDNKDTDQLQQQLSEMTYARDYYYYQMVEKQTLLEQMGSHTEKENVDQKNSSSSIVSSDTNTNNPDLDNLRKQLDDLQLVLHDKDNQIEQMKERAPTQPDQNILSQMNTLQTEIISLKQKNQQMVKENQQLQQLYATPQGETKSYSSPRGSSSSAPQDDLETLRKEQEDLLVLLTDQDTKLSKYRQRLRELGEPTTDDDDDDELNLPEDDDEDIEDLK